MSSRLHTYSTAPTPLGQQTPEQTALRHELGLGRPFWKDIAIASISAAVGAYTTHLIFQWARRKERQEKRARQKKR